VSPHSGIFQNIFKTKENLSISNQLEIIRAHPRIFFEKEGLRIADPVTIFEVLSTLKGFAASKIHGLDGCSIELFLDFFDILGLELLVVVEESRLKGKVSGALNATFLALIPKSDKLGTFEGFRPISLCNLAYKIITKIIATRIKSSLSTGISKEQFGFLEGRQITDAIRVAWEALHSVKIKKTKNIWS
jgi:hypothetical protein